MKNPPLPLAVLQPETAAPSARGVLTGARSKLGFVPNLYGVMANAPALLEAYAAVAASFDRTSFSPAERQVVLLATSHENGCDYCMAAHTAIAGMQKVDQAVVTALRDGLPIDDARLESLRAFTVEVVRSRGWPSQMAVSRFVAAGYSPAQALEVVLGVGMKTLSNYANHLAGTPLDAAFESARWERVAAGAS
jgi:AhpD family alkylhydroperoxidase